MNTLPLLDQTTSQEEYPVLGYVETILYSRKYWWELNLVVGSQIATASNINLDLAVAKADHQTAKFSGYAVVCFICVCNSTEYKIGDTKAF